MASTLTSFDAFLQQYYNPQKVEDLTKAGKPLFTMMKKNEGVGGASAGWIVPIKYVNPQGGATTLAQAQTTAAGSGGNVQGVKWAISMGDYSFSVSIGDKVMMASRNNIAAFLDDQTSEIDGAYEEHSSRLAQYIWRDGGGAIGVISSGGTTTTLTLTRPTDAFNFEVGQFLVASANDGTGAGNSLLAGSTFVTAVDRVSGIITLNAAQGAWVNNSFLFRQGDFAGNVSQTALMKGVDAFVTSSVSPGVLWGVTRTTDVQRLSGCKVLAADVAGKGIEERIQLLGAYMFGRFKCNPQGNYCCFMHPEDWQNLSISLQSRGIRSLTDSTTSFNFEYIEVLAGGKRLKVYSDPFAVKGTAYILRLDNWVLGSMGQLIRTLNGDGLTMLRAVSANDYEYRLQSYPAVSCNAPGFQGRVGLP